MRDRDLEQPSQRQTAREDELAQRLTGNELHRQEPDPLGLFHGVNDDDIGMVEGGNGLGLALETGEPLGMGCERRCQDLERHRPFQTSVLGRVDLTHPAGT